MAGNGSRGKERALHLAQKLGKGPGVGLGVMKTEKALQCA
jgi:hypothetical protein